MNIPFHTIKNKSHKQIFWNLQDDGQAWHRAYMPHKHIAAPLLEKGINLCLQKGLNSIDDFDGFILSRCPHESFMPELVKIKDQGKTLIWELDDDLFSIPSWNPAAQTYTPEVNDRVNWMRDNADYIIVSTPTLAKVVNRPNTFVLPNLIDVDLWKGERKEHKEIRVVFQGSAFHRNDLEMVAPILETIAKLDNVLVIFMGDMPERFIEWDRIFGQPYARMIPHSRYKNKVGLVHPVVIDQFPSTLLDVAPDIGICPLVNEKFAHSKSCLKFLEYSMAGAVTLAQDLPPYQGTKAILTKTWLYDLTQLIKSPNLKKLGQDAKEDVITNHSWQNKKSIWVDAFLTMIF